MCKLIPRNELKRFSLLSDLPPFAEGSRAYSHTYTYIQEHVLDIFPLSLIGGDQGSECKSLD